MSQAPQLRRTDKAMNDERVEDVRKPVIYFHTAAAGGHLRGNIDRDTRGHTPVSFVR